ncbi:TIR domain-containing protein [Bradyrhizobium sp. CCGB12]|uniref:TIR domain-containing protein n=1 Tax=Bradyrhizobium sp. CCGB12 TaxID=2949632 RepID=UPI0028124E30|nr:TIR domain-containing protein [Bradyrhizobium sp. CCGB12]
MQLITPDISRRQEAAVAGGSFGKRILLIRPCGRGLARPAREATFAAQASSRCSVWHDRRISAGQEFAAEIDRHIETDDIILLLVSADFLASDYCYDIEMTRAMERHEAGDAIDARYPSRLRLARRSLWKAECHTTGRQANHAVSRPRPGSA